MIRSLAAFYVCALFAHPALSQAQDATPPGVESHMIVTAAAKNEKKKDETNFNLRREDVQAFESKQKTKVTSVLPLQGNHAGLELLLLLDDGAGSNLATQLGDIREFITSQAPTTTVAIGYMRNGTANLVANFTKDHDAAAKALRLPIGQAGINGSPYFALTDVIKRWQPRAERREIVMITDGIDRYGAGTGLQNPYVDQATEQAQRAGIVIFSIYTGSDSRFGRSYWRTNLGQTYLSQISDRTGGESYYLGFGSPVSFKPYLDEIKDHLQHQFLVSFTASPKKKASFVRVNMETELPNLELMHAERVWVPAGY